jgi:hypothetical protein
MITNGMKIDISYPFFLFHKKYHICGIQPKENISVAMGVHLLTAKWEEK